MNDKLKKSLIKVTVSTGLLLLTSGFIYQLWNSQLSTPLNLPKIDYGTAIMMKLLVEVLVTKTTYERD